MRDAEPPAKLSFTESRILIIPYSVIEPEVKIFGNVNGLTGHFFQWTFPMKSPRTVRGSILDVAHPSETVVPESSRHSFSDHDPEPLLPNFAYNAISEVVVRSERFSDMIIDGVFPHIFHKLGLLATLLG